MGVNLLRNILFNNFRGRWNAGGTSPRFRGRGFTPNQMGQQSRRGGPQLFRGGNRGGAPRFPNTSNFDPNWNAPPLYGNSHMGFGNIQSDQNNVQFHQVDSNRLIILRLCDIDIINFRFFSAITLIRLICGSKLKRMKVNLIITMRLPVKQPGHDLTVSL